MISPEIIRRYPFFAGLSHDQIVTLAKVADDVTVEAGHYFFREGDEVKYIYLVLEGAVAMIFEVPDQRSGAEAFRTTHRRSADEGCRGQRSWAGRSLCLVRNGISAPGRRRRKSYHRCRVIVFDAQELASHFEEDCEFGYLMMQKVAQVIAGRLRDIRIESLSRFAA